MEKPRINLERRVDEARRRMDEWAFRYHMATDAGSLVAADFAQGRLKLAEEEHRKAKRKLDAAIGKATDEKGNA